MINILLTGDDMRHVCELQLCLGMMLTGREGLHGHTLYNRQRCADELLEKLAADRTYVAEAMERPGEAPVPPQQKPRRKAPVPPQEKPRGKRPPTTSQESDEEAGSAIIIR